CRQRFLRKIRANKPLPSEAPQQPSLFLTRNCVYSTSLFSMRNLLWFSVSPSLHKARSFRVLSWVIGV
ncbi:hypothetical protein C9F10_06470, partial [Salmonella enterica subsp. enterica serovar Poona]